MLAFRLAAIILVVVGCSDPNPRSPDPKPLVKQEDAPPVDVLPESVQPTENATYQAIGYARDGRLEDSITLLHDRLQQNPEDTRAKAILAQLLQEKAQPVTREGRWDLASPWLLESARLAREIRSVKGLNIDAEGLYITATYNEACAYSRLGKHDKALDSLEESLQAGFLDQKVPGGTTTRELFVSDPDLDAIRETSRFRELRDRYLKEEKPAAPPNQDPPTSAAAATC